MAEFKRMKDLPLLGNKALKNLKKMGRGQSMRPTPVNSKKRGR